MSAWSLSSRNSCGHLTSPNEPATVVSSSKPRYCAGTSIDGRWYRGPTRHAAASTTHVARQTPRLGRAAIAGDVCHRGLRLPSLVQSCAELLDDGEHRGNQEHG